MMANLIKIAVLTVLLIVLAVRRSAAKSAVTTFHDGNETDDATPQRQRRSEIAKAIKRTIGADCKTDQTGTTYMGPTSVTMSGRTCQEWSSSPRVLSAARFPDETVADAGNKCRNPDGEPGGPWCYTTDPQKRWEHCNIELCPGIPVRECKLDAKGEEYRGTISKTVGNVECQMWSSTSPHRHRFSNSQNFFPGETMEDVKNYCRNPDGESGPWCYTTSESKRWDLCDVPLCEDA